ncbi:Probable GABA transporter 2 [Durusdinium trenchii]|uniref:Probable GABA transporter 2 n=1 Tax=Durusdinium trenchii TaxID=1381693 RepID=A0ABP0RP53_9DINO
MIQQHGVSPNPDSVPRSGGTDVEVFDSIGPTKRRASLEVEVDGARGEDPDTGATKALALPQWGSSPWTNFVIVTAAYTTDNIAGPFAFQQAGWTAGVFLLAYAAATTYYTGVLLGKQTIPEGDNGSYPWITGKWLGKAGFYFAMVMQVLSYFTFIVVLLVKLGEWSSLAFRHYEESRICLNSFIAISALVLVVLTQVPTFRQVVPMAVLSLVLSFVRLILVYVQMGRYDMGTNCSPDYDLPDDESRILTFFKGLSTFAWMFGGHGMYPEEIREMKDPQENFGKALNFAYAIIILQYALMVFPAYYTWGSWTSPVLLDNLPDDNVTTLAIWISIVWMLITAAISNLLLCLTMEVHVWNLSPLVHFDPLARFPPVVTRFCHRALMVGLQLFFALMLQEAGIGNIQAFVGAFGFGALTFWLPYILELRRVRRRALLHYGLLGLGMVLTTFGIYSAVASMVAETGGQLFSTHCRQVNLQNATEGPCDYVYD